MPTAFWNAGEKEVIGGLDILGFRKMDQDLEKGWVSGITTISQRARYLSLLPWLLVAYYRQCGESHPDWGEFHRIERRLELVVLAATRLTDQQMSRKTGGLLGSDLYVEEVNALLSGGVVALQLDRGGATFGTYVVPCRNIGLIGHETLTGGAWNAPKITPRGRHIHDVRASLLGNCSLVQRILQGGSIDATSVAEQAHHFSAGALDQPAADEERSLLEDSLLRPEAGQDADAYKRFLATVRFALGAVHAGHRSSASTLAACYSQWTRLDADPSLCETTWAAYEMHRRVHFSLELFLGSLTSAIGEQDGATVENVVARWTQETALAPALAEPFDSTFTLDWDQPFSTFCVGIRPDAFLGGSIDRRPVNRLPARDRVIAALTLLTATWLRSRGKFSHERFPRAASGAEKVFPILESGSNDPLHRLIVRIIDRAVVEPHVNTTLRKMGVGLQCSLRFFPDGRVLRPTGVHVTAGFSGDRLGNVMEVLSDVGLIDRDLGGLSARGLQLLDKLGGLNDAR